MYFLKPGVKEDPVRRWNLPDRIFFGHGACHILAGVFLARFGSDAHWAEWVTPHNGLEGAHVYVTDGDRAFDYHGSPTRGALLAHHKKKWRSRLPGWDADVRAVDFDLLSTPALNERRMRGPDQYLHDPIPRAVRFIERSGVPSRPPERGRGPA